MDIFKFNPTVTPTKLEAGEIINGFKSKMWIERYSQAGEFEFVADASSGIRERLPIGSLISHVDSSEVMIVENHEISDDRDKESELVISGRGFETYLENRIVGSNRVFDTTQTSPPPGEQTLDNGYAWIQAGHLVGNHINAADLNDDNNALPYVSIFFNVTGSPGETKTRTVKVGSVYSAVLELLKIDDIGIKVTRPGPWSLTWGTSQADDIIYMIHNGVDRSSEIIFSYDTGEIESADYLWSLKSLKNAAFIYGKWVASFVTTGGIEFDRRVMAIYAPQLDERYTAEQIDADAALRAQIAGNMDTLGLETLAAQNEVALAKAEVSKDANNSRYRKDFDVGDIITVSGGYSASNKQRISEYVEIEDQNGFRGYPTLTTI